MVAVAAATMPLTPAEATTPPAVPAQAGGAGMSEQACPPAVTVNGAALGIKVVAATVSL
jgi:hypothetical protein